MQATFIMKWMFIIYRVFATTYTQHKNQYSYNYAIMKTTVYHNNLQNLNQEFSEKTSLC